MMLNKKIQVSPLMRTLSKNNKFILVFQGGSGCFIGDTLIRTITGLKKIKNIRKGDLVLSFNEKTKKITFNPVIEKFIYESEHTNNKHNLIKFKLKNGKIICTENHKFYSEGQWISARELARRTMERSRRFLPNKQQRKIKNYELEDEWKRKINESRDDSRVHENNNNNKHETNIRTSSQISSKRIYKKTFEQTRGKCHVHRGPGGI